MVFTLNNEANRTHFNIMYNGSDVHNNMYIILVYKVDL